jgi:protein-S-isoprenylcysteine O-methyltransferase Ste14
VYLGVYAAGVSVNSFILVRKNPELVAERGQPKENAKTWDKTISGLVGIASLGALVAAGLDVRFGWTPEVGPALHLVGTLTLVLGYALFSWAMISNAYFSTLVRIQDDRGHAVASSGPYQYVRHPGYDGWVILSLATPLMLGSLWALIPGAVSALLMVVRAALEDRTLLAELAGYKEYAARVRYRLLPGVW